MRQLVDETKRKISILMSVYNPNLNYFRETLESINRQTYKNYELVVVNDGWEIEELKRTLADYSFRYKIVENPINLGLPRSLNNGIKECSGEYIARIDDDDIMEPRRLEYQYRWIEKHPSYDAVFSDYTVIDGEGRIAPIVSKCSNKSLKRNLRYRGNCLCHSSLFIKKNVMITLGGYDEKLTYAQDYDLYLRLIKNSNIYIIPRKLIRFRSESSRISQNKRFLSALFAYYASLKSLSSDYSFSVFASRSLRTLLGIAKIMSCHNNKHN